MSKKTTFISMVKKVGEDCERGQNAQLSVQGSPQNTDDQHCFSMPCLSVLISHFQIA